ncbi:MAG TPA: hypothetical protein VH062_30800 [Polyangiaceae bacterium]|jgi:hypothetical protein|nr:hypothetical protein [Polyangiaceae bacterium]
MAAAWSFSRGGSQNPVSISRLVSTLTLDGDRISADLIIGFHRTLSNATAESVADEVARAATEVLGDQITQGEVPLAKDELVTRLRARISVSAQKITDIEAKAIYLVGSEVNANKSTFRTRYASPPPPAVGAAHKSGSIPALRQSSPALTPPPSPRVRTLWPSALSTCGDSATVAEVGSLLGPALRDSVAAAILHAFVAVDPEVADRMELFSGGETVQAILVEVSACFASAAYRLFAASGVENGAASELVRVALRHVLAAEAFPASQIAQYMSSDSPVRDLATRVAAAMGAPDTAGSIQGAVSPYCEALRDDLLSVASDVRRLIA